jgi:nucleotide-binding universal stress UspA family protein
MYSINRIVVTTDMSPISAYADSRAALLAHELGIKSLDLLHVIDTLSLKTLGELVQAHEQAKHKLLDSCRKQLAEIEKRLKDEYGVSVTTTALNVGRAHTEVVHYAELLNAGLLVMGVHSGGVVRDLFVGSTVDKVLRMAPCPVLVVKQRPEAAYQRVIVGVDFSESSLRSVEVAMSVAPHASITVLHAFQMPFQANFSLSEEQTEAYLTEIEAEKIEQLEKIAAEFASERLSIAVEPGPAPGVIREQIEALHSDLVVVGKHGKSGLEDLLLGSVTKEVMQYAGCDVLVVR